MPIDSPDPLDELLDARISPGAWQDDPYYVSRAVSLGAAMGADAWSTLMARRSTKSLSWAERLVEVLSLLPAQQALLRSLMDDPAPSVRALVREALESE
jgi:hypothetical protein